MEPVRGEADLDRIRRTAAAWAVFCAWAQAGLLHALADGRPRRLSELPGDHRALQVTAPILGHLGLLVRVELPDGEAWCLSHAARELQRSNALIPGATPQDVLARLPVVLAEGGPAPGPDGVRRPHKGGVQPHDPEASAVFLDMLYRRSGPAADDTAAAILARLGGPGRALDLGGGHGRYGASLAALGFEVTLFDQPLVVELARRRHGEKLRYRAGDFDGPDFGPDAAGGAYDVVLASNIVHGMGPDAVLRLLGQLRSVVRPGGLLVLKDMFIDDTGVGPEPGVLFGLTMLLFTSAGRSYGVSELKRALAEAGFDRAELVSVTDQGYMLLIAR